MFVLIRDLIVQLKDNCKNDNKTMI